MSDFMSSTKPWNLNNLNGILLDHIINAIRSIPIPVTNIDDTMFGNSQMMVIFRLKLVGGLIMIPLLLMLKSSL